MYKSSLIQVLKTLTEDELKQFNKWLKSPFFNERKPPIQLFDLLIKLHPKFDRNKANKESLFKKLFPKETYSDIKIRQLMSYLNKQLEQFLSYRAYTSNTSSNLLGSLRERDTAKSFEANYKKEEEELTANIQKDEDYFLRYFQLSVEWNKYLEQKAQKASRSVKVEFNKADYYLDLFYLTNKLKLYIDIVNYRSIVGGDDEVFLMDEILKQIENSKYAEAPILAIYHSILLTQLEPNNEQHFKKLKSLLTDNASNYDKHDARRMYGMAQNYCIKKINTGKTDYLAEIFDIYKQLLQQKIIFENDMLSPWDYKNIVTVGLRLNELDWTKSFIHDYKNYIDESHRENAFTYNLSKYYYQIKNYDEVLQLLLQVEYNDIFYNLDSKVLLVKTYYETDEIDPLMTLLDTFQTFIRRQKQLTDYHKTIYSNHIKFVKKLINIPVQNKKQLLLLKQEIEGTKQVADINWLTQKIDEIT